MAVFSSLQLLSVALALVLIKVLAPVLGFANPFSSTVGLQPVVMSEAVAKRDRSGNRFFRSSSPGSSSPKQVAVATKVVMSSPAAMKTLPRFPGNWRDVPVQLSDGRTFANDEEFFETYASTCSFDVNPNFEGDDE